MQPSTDGSKNSVLSFDSSSPLAGALSIARYGLRVAWGHAPLEQGCTCGRPSCTSRGKHPVLAAWQKRATTDEHELRDQFSKFTHERSHSRKT